MIVREMPQGRQFLYFYLLHVRASSAILEHAFTWCTLMVKASEFKNLPTGSKWHEH